jgi:glycerate 2-kinase
MIDRGEGAGAAGLVRAILDAAVAAVEPGALVARCLGASPPAGAPIHVVAFGKAALGMAGGAVAAVGERIGSGVVLCPPGVAGPAVPSCIERFEADHPLPTARNVAATSRLAEGLRRAAMSGETVLALVSGGGSAHLTMPAEGLSLSDLRDVTAALSRAGAAIDELNAVRKHVEQFKGGGLARLADGVDVRVLILSDVIGDRLDTIASGPLWPDPTTYADALRVLARYDARAVSLAVTAHLERGAAGERPETPKPGDALFARVTSTVVGSNRDAVKAAAACAASLGVGVVGCEFDAVGDGESYGRRVARIARDARAAPQRRPVCWIGGGETTVRVGAAGGIGGRCQEAALAAASEIAGVPGIVIAMLATDGVDGPPVAGRAVPAGAMVTGRTALVMREAGIDPEKALVDHDSGRALAAAGALIETGPTGTNVNDIAVALVYPGGDRGGAG